MANTAEFGLAAVQLGEYSWTHSSRTLAEWVGTGPKSDTEVKLQFAVPTPR